jgi:DNA-binding MarR family transcriptional regulator
MVERTPGITGLVDRLEAKGLVVRETPKHDRRLVHCRIAKKGLDLLELLDDPIEAGNRKAFSSLSARELQQLISLLNKLRKPHEDL